MLTIILLNVILLCVLHWFVRRDVAEIKATQAATVDRLFWRLAELSGSTAHAEHEIDRLLVNQDALADVVSIALAKLPQEKCQPAGEAAAAEQPDKKRRGRRPKNALTLGALAVPYDGPAYDIPTEAVMPPVAAESVPALETAEGSL